MQSTTPPVQCKVVNQDDQEFRPIPTPLREGSFMLELCPAGEGYIFPSKARALSAIHHTAEYKKSIGVNVEYSDYIVFDLR
jgi:hypothetical protein